MSTRRRVPGRVLAIVAALAAGGCPPPGDVKRAPKTPSPTESPPDPKAPPSGREEKPAPADTGKGGGEAPAPVSSDPQAPAPTSGSRPTAYERLSGGTFVPRCPTCGTVQPSGSTRCSSCKQELRPRGQEQTCEVCAGKGRCDRCGDDRACLDCDGQGQCTFCSGQGKVAGQKCVECGGNGKCVTCGGDGVREATSHDFGPYDTALPGICPTCVDGSGLCPDCGTLTKDPAGGPCLSCGGLGVCFDCGGTGLCPHDAADGLCLVCRGSGREVVDAAPPKLADRVWALRREGGSQILGRVTDRPDPNVHLQVTQGGTVSMISLTRAQLDPLSYYLAKRDWTPVNDGEALLSLGTVALSSKFWGLAQEAFRRAKDASPALAPQVAGQVREVEERRITAWAETADAMKKKGDREGAVLLLNMIRFKARGTPQATQADVKILQIQRDREEEDKNLDATARQRLADESKARAERASGGAKARLDRAKALLRDAQHLAADDPGVERMLARADQAAYSAQRLVLREAYRNPASATPWPVKPEASVREARLLRAEIAIVRASREIAGGRFDFGARLARRASSLDGGNPQPQKLLDAAELGLARAGALRGSPPPEPK